jgi:hypothetical protein
MPEEKPIVWNVAPPHTSIWGNVFDDMIEGHLTFRSKLEELADNEKE